MIKKENSGLSFLVFEQLSRQKFLRHGVSVRGQVIKGQDGRDRGVDFDLSSKDNPFACENREWFCRALGLPFSQLVRVGQVHGCEVKVVEEGGCVVDDVDGVCTREPGVGLLLLGADCPLVVVFDPVKVAIGVAHAGWRGTVGGISGNLVAVMVEAFGCDAADMIAGIGPGISWPYYEVGADVAEAVRSRLPDADSVLRRAIDEKRREDRWQLDLVEANRLQFLRAGLRAEHVEVSGCCTYRDEDLFFSYRRDGEKAGRWGLLAGLTPAFAGFTF